MIALRWMMLFVRAEFGGSQTWLIELGLCLLWFGVSALDCDEPESLILAQSERWRHA